MRDILNVIKTKGVISPTDMTANNTLSVDKSRKVINTIVDSSDFLKKINVYQTKKLQTSIDTWNLAKGILVRVAPGNSPTDEQRQKLGVGSVTLDNKPVQLFAKITQDTLEDNADNPKFESETFESFARAFATDLQNLGMIGEKDDYSSNEFKNLNKGWFTLAKEVSGVKKIEHKKASKMVDKLAALVKAHNEEVLKDSVILISQADYLAFQTEVGSKNGGLGVLLNANAKSILDVPLEVAAFVPKGKFLMTPLKNLVMSLGLAVRRVRWYDNEESSLKYKFEVYNDYQIAVPEWVTLSEENESDTDGDGI
ncbi:P2 family phage major capsid protein [Campylobacter pinnipediorum]|uniref:P2 family phage major capsid protein n=1 Tax=Campylobacter pinnipediorum TaxID=1965231 RepID=UPI0009C3518B|nr:P2 family phage major capsid protein [Campylobacter pinnipediorum]AQW80784.1 phage capsid family protein [Campylobacter pinnipediorum subsp. pinnipediorum]AQW83330.1 phage capsid family protein [Campylobacter pinnipediorum subsp. pinnipediorum]